MTLLLGLSITDGISAKFMSKGNRGSWLITSMMYMISVPSIGLAFQVYAVAIVTSTNTSDVLRSLVEIFSV